MTTSVLVWGTWLLAFALTFSFSSSINSYYTAALSPPVAGLIAVGAMLAWRRRRSVRARLIVAATVLITVGYAAWLLPAAGTGLAPWLAPAIVILGLLVVVAMLLSSRISALPQLLPATLVGSFVIVLVVPAAASATVASNRLGPFDTPFQPAAVTQGVRAFFDVATATSKLLPTLEQARRGAPDLMATQTSALAAPFIYVSGQEVLPIGGFTGTIPEPSLAAIRSMIRAGDFHLVLQSPSTTDPRLVWIARHCISIPQPAGVSVPSRTRYAIHYCLPRS